MSTDRILDDAHRQPSAASGLRDMLLAQARKQPVDARALEAAVSRAVTEVVRAQCDVGTRHHQ